MKNLLFILAILCLSTWTFAQNDTLTVLFANDTHSNLAPIGERTQQLKGTVGGIARAATLIGMTKMNDPNVLVVHSGDILVGDIFYNATFGVAELQMMANMGYDALTLGNHELDLGPAMLEKAVETSLNGGTMSIVASNIMFPDGKRSHLKNYTNEYVVRQCGPVKVGIFGLCTPEANIRSNPAPLQIDECCRDHAIVDIANLKEVGATVIICLSHMGLAKDAMLAASVSGIDLIIGAHDHLSIPAKAYTNPSGKTTWVAQTAGFYQEMGKIQLLLKGAVEDPKDGNIELLSAELIPLNSKIPEQIDIANEVDLLIAGIEEQFGPMFTQKIGTSTEFFSEVQNDLNGSGIKETAIGNLVTDAFREYTNTDIAIEPGGCTAQPLHKGPIVGDDLFRVFGYGFNEKNYLGFRLVTFSITGENLWNALEISIANSLENDEFFPQVSGMRFASRYNPVDGSRIKWVLVNGEPLDFAKTYTVTTNELALNVLTTMFGIAVSDVAVDDVTEYQALRAYVTERGTISPVDRFTNVSKHAGTMSPADKLTEIVGNTVSMTPDKFALGQNYPNPFNPSTTIRYTLPVLSKVKLTVHDLLGSEIATLVDGVQTAGWKEVQWNAHGAASGMYFYKLQTDNFVDTKKMVLMK